MTAGETSQALRNAAALLKRGGWCQRSFTDGTRHCALGALQKIRPSRWARDSFALAAAGDVQVNIADWNDDQSRTADEVIAAFEEAARIAESAELTDKHWPEVAS